MNSNKLKETLVLESGLGNKQYWRDLFRYRDLFFMLAKRDVSVRYKQTVIGILWAVLRPFLTMLILTFIFGLIAKMPSRGIPYPLLVFSGMLPWFFFSSSVAESSNSLIANSNLLSKVYFPRIIIPTSAVIVAVIDFLIGLFLLLIMMIYYGIMPSWRLLLLPFVLVTLFCAALGIGLWFSALNVRYRDFQFVVPFMLQFGIYISPVGFISSVIPENYYYIYALNPIAGVIDAFRWIIFGDIFLPRFEILLISVLFSVLLLITGITFFRRFERSIADVI